MQLVEFDIFGTNGEKVLINPEFVQSVKMHGKSPIIYLIGQTANGSQVQYQVNGTLEEVAVKLTV